MTIVLLLLMLTASVALWLIQLPRNQQQQLVNTIIRTCQGDVHCTGQELAALVKNHNTPLVLDVMVQVIAEDAVIDDPGHTYAHEIGYATFARYPTLSEQLSQCRDHAAGGCYHGVMMKYVASNGIPSTEKVTHVCDQIQDQHQNIYKDCLHGLGHGVMMGFLMNTQQIPGLSEIKSALQTCDGLRSEYEQYHCHRGAFMEYMMAANTHVFHYPAQATYDAQDMHWPCSKLSDAYLAACYDYQGTHLLENTTDLRTAFQECAGVKQPGNQHCTQNLGRSLNGDANQEWNALLVKKCTEATSSAQRRDCLIGAAQYHLYFDHNIEAAVDLCQQGITPQDPGRICLKAVVQEAQQYQIREQDIQRALQKYGAASLL